MRYYLGGMVGLVITVTLIVVLAVGAFGPVTPGLTTSQVGAMASLGASPIAGPIVTPATPFAAQSSEGGTLVISGTGETVTEDFPLEAGRYEVTVDLAWGCCISLSLNGPSGSEDVLLDATFSSGGGTAEGGTVTEMYQVGETGMYFIDSRLAWAEWTVTFEPR